MLNRNRSEFNRSQFTLVLEDLFNGQETFLSRDGTTYATRYVKTPPKHPIEHQTWRANQREIPNLPI